jgi:hypothetical protein
MAVAHTLGGGRRSTLRQGACLLLVVLPEGEINGFEMIFQVEQGWYPRCDQPTGQPIELPGLGKVYTQHLYVVNPATLP